MMAEGAEHGVGDEGFEVRAAFAFQVGLANGGGLVGESVFGEGAVVAGEETGVETRCLADALKVGGAVGGDNGGYEVGDGYFTWGLGPRHGPLRRLPQRHSELRRTGLSR